MKILLHHHVLTLLLVAFLAISGNARAQEASSEFGPMETDGGTIDRESIPMSPGEKDIRYTSKSSSESTGDSTAVVNQPPVIPKVKTEKQSPATKPAVEKQSKEEDDSILSFNFLYYIIEKYKLQDIVER